MVRRNKRKSHRRKSELQNSPALYLNRELSMLAFNERVLAMATRTSVPLAERLRYVCIVSSNLDEFFEVRISDLSEEIRETGGASPQAPVYAEIMQRAQALVHQQYTLFNQTIAPALARRDIVIVTGAWTNMSIEHTSRTGADKGYYMVVPEDCCSTMNAEWHTASVNYALQNVAVVTDSDALVGSWS